MQRDEQSLSEIILNIFSCVVSPFTCHYRMPKQDNICKPGTVYEQDSIDNWACVAFGVLSNLLVPVAFLTSLRRMKSRKSSSSQPARILNPI
eukprot:730234-Amphidinium_carterae.1